MKRSSFSEEQIIRVLKEHEAGLPTAELCRRHGISAATFYRWKSKFGGMEVAEAKRPRALEDENAKLKKLLAEVMLDIAVLKDITGKSGDARREAGCSSACPGGVRAEQAAGVQRCWRQSPRGAVSIDAARRCASAPPAARVGG